MTAKFTIFISYSHKDEELREELEKHFSSLTKEGFLIWHDRKISPGQEWAEEIDNNLNSAQIILLLVSPDFIASEFCYSLELKRAIERHEKNEARVIPIILRHVPWKKAPFGKLQALPRNAKPVKSWLDLDEALCSVVEDVCKVIEELTISISSAPLEQNEKIPLETTLSILTQQSISASLLLKGGIEESDEYNFDLANLKTDDPIKGESLLDEKTKTILATVSEILTKNEVLA